MLKRIGAIEFVADFADIGGYNHHEFFGYRRSI